MRDTVTILKERAKSNGIVFENKMEVKVLRGMDE
jgi:hypothetical protein